MDIRLFAAAKALIVHNGKVLILRESSKYNDGTQVGKYDVPGGRVTPGERFDDGLVREIKEETGLSVKIGKPVAVSEWRPQVRGEQWHIVATFFLCEANGSEIQLSEDHDAYEWIDPAEFEKYNIIETNKVAFQALLNQ